MNKTPLFPIKVVFEEGKEEWLICDENEAACSLEWFDSDDSEERAVVLDKLGRPVRLKVECLKIILCELRL